MAEYVPTTEDVREDFAYPWEGFTQDKPARQAAFDAWLEAHDREVATNAWDEGYRTGESNSMASLRAGGRIVSDNPYIERGE